MRGNAIRDKSYSFALEVVILYRDMRRQHEFVLSNQMVRAGTSIGANVEEAMGAQSRRDFISKLSIARKEARECGYWLRLIHDSDLAPRPETEALIEKSHELIRLLTAIILTSQQRDRVDAPARIE